MQCREGSEGVGDALTILEPGSVSPSSVCLPEILGWAAISEGYRICQFSCVS